MGQMYRKGILLIFILCGYLANAQLYNNGGVVFVNADADVAVSGMDLVNTGSTSQFTNKGNIVISGNTPSSGSFRNRPSSGLFSNQGQFFVENNFLDSSHFVFSSTSGRVILNGSSSQAVYMGGVENRIRTLVLQGGGNKFLRGYLNIQDSLLFGSGHMIVNSSDTLLIDSTGTTPLTGFGAASSASFVSGRIYRKTFGSAYFPVGKIAGGFRPAELTNIPVASVRPVVGFEFKSNNFGLNGPNIDITSPGFKNHWKITAPGGIPSSPVKLSYTASDFTTAPVASEMAVGQTDSVGSSVKWWGLGQSASTANSVTSASSVSQSFVSIGQCKNLKLRISAFLQGADSVSGFMHRAPHDTLEKYFGSNGLITKMYPSFNVPALAVDRIFIYIVNNSFIAVDSVPAWLMYDGSIRDYYTGTAFHVTYCTPSAGNFYVVVRHRNHLSVMSSGVVSVKSTNTFTGLTEGYVDLTAIAQIYGAGAALISGGKAAMFAGNARNGDQEVNAEDLYDVTTAQNILLKGYKPTDMDMNMVTNALDFNITSTGNTNLYFSTVP